jgi:hypothetical protein
VLLKEQLAPTEMTSFSEVTYPLKRFTAKSATRFHFPANAENSSKNNRRVLALQATVRYPELAK